MVFSYQQELENLYQKFNDNTVLPCYIMYRIKTGLRVRKGEAIMQMYMYSFKNTYRPYDIKGTDKSSAYEAARFNLNCLSKFGSGVYLGSGGAVRVSE